MIFLLNIFCKHKWKMLSEVVTKSQLELMSELGKRGELYNPFERKVIHILSCEKCGKLKKYVEKLK